MGLSWMFCALFYLTIQMTTQFSVDRDSTEGMVSDAWFDDILTDGWNGVPRGCGGKPADIYFVMDTSRDTNSETVREQKRFLSDLSALFYLHKSSSRLGIVSYGKKTRITSPLGAYDTLPEVQAAVQDAPSIGGSRKTAKAMKYLRTYGFSPFVARKEVAHVVIWMTNGFSTDAKQVAKEASLLRKQGVYVYVVSSSTSGHVDKGELVHMASTPPEKFVFSSDDLSIVDSLIDLLHIKECNYQVLPPLPGKGPACISRRPAEIVFAVEHLGLGSPKTQRIISFIQDFLAEVDPDSDIKAAITTSKDPVSQRALSSQVETIQNLEQTLGRVVFPDLGSLLRRARRSLRKGTAATRAEEKNSSKWRSADVQKVMVVFTDDKMQLTKTAMAAARANRRHKVDTYVIYVGDDSNLTNMPEVTQLASGEDHLIRVPDYKTLRDQSTVLSTLRTVCRGL